MKLKILTWTVVRTVFQPKSKHDNSFGEPRVLAVIKREFAMINSLSPTCCFDQVVIKVAYKPEVCGFKSQLGQGYVSIFLSKIIKLNLCCLVTFCLHQAT